MNELVPLLEDAINAAEKILLDSHGKACCIKLYTCMNEQIQSIVERAAQYLSLFLKCFASNLATIVPRLIQRSFMRENGT